MSLETEDQAAADLRALQKEWRDSVSESLRELREQGAATISRLEEMKKDFAARHHVERLTEHVGQLQADRAKVIGGLVVFQVVGSAVLYLLTKRN